MYTNTNTQPHMNGIILTTKEELSELVSEAVRSAMSNGNKATTQKKEFIKGIHQLAAFLKVSAPRAQKLKNEKVISCFQDGRLVLFDPDKVREEMAAYNQRKRVKHVPA